MGMTPNPIRDDERVTMSTFSWADLVGAVAGPPQKIIVYPFSNGRGFQDGQGSYDTAPEIL